MTTLNPPFKAKDMKALYKKVIKGQYPDIPPHYSKELNTMISMCLRVSSTARPSADQLLRSRELSQKIKFYEGDFENDENINTENIQDQLLQTIKLPSQMKNIKLPKSKYNDTKSTKRSHSYDNHNKGASLNSRGRQETVHTGDSTSRIKNSKLTLLK